jgi:hypothetical protein
MPLRPSSSQPMRMRFTCEAWTSAGASGVGAAIGRLGLAVGFTKMISLLKYVPLVTELVYS